MIGAIISESRDKPDISMEAEVFGAMMELRNFMFENVYLRPYAIEEEKKAFNIIESLYNLYMSKPELIERTEGFDESRTMIKVRDYIAGMTDRYARDKFCRYFLPSV